MSITAPALRQRMRHWTLRFTRTASAPVTLSYRSIYLLPTRNGLLFAFMLFVMWLGAVNYGNSMIFAFVFLLVSMALLAILHTFRNLRGLRVSPLPADPVFAGESATFTIQLENPGRVARTAVGLRVGPELMSVSDVPAQGRTSLQLRLPSERRGWLQAPRFRLFTIFPVGLFQAWTWLDFRQRCLVYPKPETGPVPEPAGSSTDGSGPGRSRGQEDFRELRRYRPGDSPRHIAWRLVARGLEPQTKEFGGETQTPVWFDWNTLGRLEGTEARLSRLCRWVLDADAAQRRYGLRLPHIEIPVGRGSEHRDRCLKALALFPQ